MSANGYVRLVGLIYAKKVAFESFFDAIFGLANILAQTGFARNAIDKIIAIAGDVFHGGKLFARRGTSDET